MQEIAFLFWKFFSGKQFITAHLGKEQGLGSHWQPAK